MGLKERIQNASTSKEVDDLLKKGKGFTWASEGTKRRWGKVAADSKVRISTPRKEKSKKNEK